MNCLRDKDCQLGVVSCVTCQKPIQNLTRDILTALAEGKIVEIGSTQYRATASYGLEARVLYDGDWNHWGKAKFPDVTNPKISYRICSQGGS